MNIDKRETDLIQNYLRKAIEIGRKGTDVPELTVAGMTLHFLMDREKFNRDNINFEPGSGLKRLG